MTEEKILIARRARWLYLAAGALIVAAVIATVVWLGPLPPKVVVMTTGTPGSAYDVFAQRYKQILARSGVELQLMPSAGGVDNLKRLNDPRSDISVGFAQDGLTDAQRSPGLNSLGTLFYEPLWFFYRGLKLGPRLEELHGKRLSIGPDGSGTRALALQLLALNRIDPNMAQLLPLTAAQSAEALLKREIDAAFMVASWDTAAVRQLLASSEVELVSLGRADTYVALYPFLTKLVLPTGVGDMVTNRPPTDVNLVAPKASLIVRKGLHPAIQYLLLDAAVEIHSAPSIFNKAGQFPAPEAVDLPLSKDAYQFHKSGLPFLMRYLPFWLAILAGHLLLLLLPVVGVAYPLLRVAPALYGWGMRRRIFRLYGELKFIEIELEARGGRAAEDLLVRLDRLEDHANHLRIPVGFAQFLYALRLHIDLVRTRLQSSQ